MKTLQRNHSRLSMKKVPHIALLSLLILFTTAAGFAQNSQPEMADALRANGKIYVVVAVLSIVFTGIAIYLFALDRKITSIEKKINKNQN